MRRLALMALLAAATRSEAALRPLLGQTRLAVARSAIRSVATVATEYSPPARNSTRPLIQLVTGKSRLFQDGNPLVFGGAVSKGTASAGQDVDVADHHGNVVARGFYNPHSQYRVRVTALQTDRCFDYPTEELIASHIRSAVGLRRALFLPSSTTDAYRLVNGEGDSLSGLIVDVLGPQVIVQSSALWVEIHARAIAQALVKELGVAPEQLQWRPAMRRLQQDGLEHLKTVNPFGTVALSPMQGEVRELGLAYTLADQKTGFYCDQRDNRQLLRGLCRDRSVLDAYCYTGGFALNALAGGAKAVTALDSSRPAIDIARTNARNNGFLGADEESNEALNFIVGDAVEEMRKLRQSGNSYDVVVLDPPKLAPTRSSLNKALGKYRSINMAGMALVKNSGGLLLTCTCSAAATQSHDGYVSMLINAAKQLGKRITVLQTNGAAPDHVVNPAFPESRYLTAMLLHVR